MFRLITLRICSCYMCTQTLTCVYVCTNVSSNKIQQRSRRTTAMINFERRKQQEHRAKQLGVAFHARQIL